MIKQIVFKKTNNFWIDNGIVGLFKILQFVQENITIKDENEIIIEYEISLGADSLKIELSNPNKEGVGEKDVHQDLIRILNSAKEVVVKNYFTATNNAGWLLKNNQFEVYRKNDFKMHLKSFFTGKTPQTEGGLCVPVDKKEIEDVLKQRNIKYSKDKDNTFSLIEQYYKNYNGKKESDRKQVTIPNFKKEDVKNNRIMNEDELITFLDFVKDNSYISFGDGKPTILSGRGFINSQPRHEIGSDFEAVFFEEGKKICAFSGKNTKIADMITGMDYPFITGKSGELNFASNLENKPVISAEYSFIALFSFNQLHYLRQDKISNYFVLYDNSLKELSNFYNTIQMNLSTLRNSDYCNFTNSMYNLELEAETLFDFAISVYQQVKGKLSKDERKGLYNKSIFTFTNDGNIFRDVREYTSLAVLFDFFDTFDELGDETVKFDQFLNLVRFFTKKMKTSKGDKYDTTWRNRLCSDLLHFRSIAKTIEWYFGEVKLKEEKPTSIYNLDKIISIYNNKTQFNMKSEMVDLCKSIGNRIGRYCRENDNKGILFSIRNAKNRVEFLNVLAESQFRTEVSYGEEFFKTLPDTPQWEEYKALVSIFAMNSYLYKPSDKPIN